MISRRTVLGSVASLLVTLTRGWRYPRVERWGMALTDDPPTYRFIRVLPCSGGTWRVDTSDRRHIEAFEVNGLRPTIGTVYRFLQTPSGRWFFWLGTAR